MSQPPTQRTGTQSTKTDKNMKQIRYIIAIALLGLSVSACQDENKIMPEPAQKNYIDIKMKPETDMTKAQADVRTGDIYAYTFGSEAAEAEAAIIQSSIADGYYFYSIPEGTEEIVFSNKKSDADFEITKEEDGGLTVTRLTQESVYDTDIVAGRAYTSEINAQGELTAHLKRLNSFVTVDLSMKPTNSEELLDLSEYMEYAYVRFPNQTQSVTYNADGTISISDKTDYVEPEEPIIPDDPDNPDTPDNPDDPDTPVNPDDPGVVESVFDTLTIESVLWEGECVISTWDYSHQDLSWGKYDWKLIEPNTLLSVDYTVIDPAGYTFISVRSAVDWVMLPSCSTIPGNEEYGIPVANDTDNFQMTLTAEDLSRLQDSDAGMILTGQNYIVNKISLFKEEIRLKDGKYWMVFNDGLVAEPVPEDASYGYPAVTEGTTGNDINAFTFTRTDEGYTIQDSYGRYMYLTGTYNSFNVAYDIPYEGHLYEVTPQEDGTFIIRNILKNKTVQYHAGYNSVGIYSEIQGTYPELIKAVAGDDSGNADDPGDDNPGDDDNTSYINPNSLIYNGDFESNTFGDSLPDGWTKWEGSPAVDNSETHSGTNAIRLYQNGWQGITADAVYVEQGKTYRFGVWVKTDINRQDFWFNTNNSQFNKVEITAGEWTYVYADYTANATTSLNLQLDAYISGSGNIYIDDVELYELEEQTSTMWVYFPAEYGYTELYCWGEDGTLHAGGWPGTTCLGYVEIDGRNYYAWEISLEKRYAGTNAQFIFSYEDMYGYRIQTADSDSWPLNSAMQFDLGANALGSTAATLVGTSGITEFSATRRMSAATVIEGQTTYNICTEMATLPTAAGKNSVIELVIGNKAGNESVHTKELGYPFDPNKHYRLTLAMRRNETGFGFEIEDIIEESFDIDLN